MSNHPSVPNWRAGPPRPVHFATGFYDAPIPTRSTPVHNGPSMAVYYEPTEKPKPKKQHDGPKPDEAQKKKTAKTEKKKTDDAQRKTADAQKKTDETQKKP